jgi:transcriptional regulator with XRE-family HTH domain
MSRFEVILREARKRTRLTQKELAKKVAISESYLGKLETGVLPPPARDVVLKLAAALEMSEESKRDLLLAANAAGSEDLKGLNLQAISPIPPSTAQLSDPPAAPAAAGSVLQQLLEQMQTLTTAVSHLHADVADLKQRVAIISPTPAGLPGDDALPYPFIGHWQGHARQNLPEGTTIDIKRELQMGVVMNVPRDLTVTIGWLLHLESAGDAQLSGHGLLEFDCYPLGDNLVKRVAVDITGAVVRAGRLSLELQDIEEHRPLVRLIGRLTDDGRGLRGDYLDLWLAKDKSVMGAFALQKTPGSHPLVEHIRTQDTGKGAAVGAARGREKPAPE